MRTDGRSRLFLRRFLNTRTKNILFLPLQLSAIYTWTCFAKSASAPMPMSRAICGPKNMCAKATEFWMLPVA